MSNLELTVDTAAKQLHRSASTVRRWLRDGRLHGRKDERGGPGGTWRVNAESCEQMAAQLTAEMNTEMAATVMPQPAIDTITLKALAELTAAVQELTGELREPQKALPAPAEDQQQRINALEEKVRELEQELVEQKLYWLQRAWRWLKGGQ